MVRQNKKERGNLEIEKSRRNISDIRVRMIRNLKEGLGKEGIQVIVTRITNERSRRKINNIQVRTNLNRKGDLGKGGILVIVTRITKEKSRRKQKKVKGEIVLRNELVTRARKNIKKKGRENLEIRQKGTNTGTKDLDRVLPEGDSGILY